MSTCAVLTAGTEVMMLKDMAPKMAKKPAASLGVQAAKKPAAYVEAGDEEDAFASHQDDDVVRMQADTPEVGSSGDNAVTFARPCAMPARA